MQLRSIKEQNETANEERKKRIDALKGVAHAEDVKVHTTLEEKLAAYDPNSRQDPDLNYIGLRASKRANAEIKLEVAISQQQQEQQQQQQQQQMQVAQTQQSRDPALKHYEIYKGYKNLISIQHIGHGNKTDKHALDELTRQYPHIEEYQLKKIAGIHESQTGGLGYLTLDAAKVIAEQHKQFGSGVFLNHLPDGFCVFTTEGERHLPLRPDPPAKLDAWGRVIKEHSYDRREFPRLVLDYKPQLKHPKHPLKLNLMVPPGPAKIEGTPAQFNVEGGEELFSHFKRRKHYDLHQIKTAERNAQRELFYQFMRGQNKSLADVLIKKYPDFFASFNYNEICGLWDIFYHSGCEGLEIILDKFQRLTDADRELFLYFRNSFLENSPNWAEFLEDDAQVVFNKITELTPAQRTWWNSLSYQHIFSCGWANLNDLYAAFEHFCNQYRLIGREKCGPAQHIELPARYSLRDAKNMKTVVARVLTVMQNTRNFHEQASNLHGINFNSNDVYYASAHQQYSLITAEMYISDYKTPEYATRLKENKDADADIRLTFDDLHKMLETTRIYPYLYKFLGIQSYSAPYHTYVRMLDDLAYPMGRYLLSLNATQRNKLAFLLTVTTTHKRGYQCDIQQQLALLLPLFATYPSQVDPSLNRLIALIKDARWLSLAEVTVIAKLFFETTELKQPKKIADEQHKFLHDFIVDNKEEFSRHLDVYAKNKVPLEPKTYVSCLYLLNKEKDEQLKTKLARIFSLVHTTDFRFDDIKVLVSLLRNFEIQNGKHAYNELIDIFSILKLKDENKPAPSLPDFIATIKKIEQMAGSSTKNRISKSLPENCYYNAAECRSIIPPPLGVAKVLEGYKREFKDMGIARLVPPEQKQEFAEGKDPLSFIVLISHIDRTDGNAPKTRWRKISEKYVLQWQKEQLREHAEKLVLENENDKRIRDQIILEVYPPGPFTEVESSLVPMREYSEQIAIFIEALIRIKSKWPEDKWPQSFATLLKEIYGDPAEQSLPRSIKFLNDFLAQITETFSGKLPFPIDIFTMLMAHEKKYGADPKTLAIDHIFGAKGVTLEHKMQLLKLNLDSAANKVNAAPFIINLLKYQAQFAPIFSPLLTIIEKYANKREIILVFEYTLTLLKLLVEMNNKKFTESLFTLLAKHPEAYLDIIYRLAHVPVPEEPTEPKIHPHELLADEAQEHSGKEAADDAPKKTAAKAELTPPAPKRVNARQIITELIFQCCDASEFNKDDILYAILALAREKDATLQALREMRPPPSLKTLQIVLRHNFCQKFLANPTQPFFCYRLLDEQFETSRAVSAIEAMRDLTNGKKLNFSQRRRLLQQFLLVNRFGHHANSPIYLREVAGKKVELTAKDLTAAELKYLVIQCRAVFKDPNASPPAKENARLVFLALIREATWKITRKFPYSTQMLSVINAVFNPGSLLSEIDTGEGKGMIMAMMAANLWFEGKAVNVCTSNLELARVAFEEFAPVFDLLGIPRSGKIITSQTSVTEYCYDGINYSDTSQLSLFIAKQKLDPYYIKYHQHDPLALALDEADFTFFDDSTHYRYATTLHQTDLTWVFPVLYQFVTSPTSPFKSPTATIGDDIENARKLLLQEAARLQKDVAYVEKLSDRQIDTWLESAIAASRLKEGKEFVVRAETRGFGEDSYYVSFARILANSRVSEGAEWSNGVHQFLHARLNEERETKQRRIPSFPIDPETAPIASMSSQNVTEHHLERGRIFCVTGTAGTPDELKELEEKGIKASRIPPHKPNKRTHDAPVLANGEEDHFAKIVGSILRHLRQNEDFFGLTRDEKPQPILVAFNDIDKSQRFYDYLQKQLKTPRFARYHDLLNSQLLNGSKSSVNGNESHCSEGDVVSKAGVAGWITVSTLLDRGTDIIPRLNADDAKQNHPNGLFALQTFVASERLSRQIEGRAARLGHVGQTQLVLDQKEFAELLDANPMNRGIEAVKLLQESRARSEKSKRRFAERLGSIKNYFFNEYIQYIQDEKNITPDLNRKWAACLNNMDIEWQRLFAKPRKEKLNERELLEKCTTSLIIKACKEWNNIVPDDSTFLLPPGLVEKNILEKNLVKTAAHAAVEEESRFPLRLNHVSPARYCIEKSPLLTTMLHDKSDAKEIDAIHKQIERNRLSVAEECIAQIFDKKINTGSYREFLQTAFSSMIDDAFKESPQTTFRKKLLEIFALGRWSKHPGLEADIARTFLSSLYSFSLRKMGEYPKEFPSIHLSKAGKESLSKEAATIVALLECLKNYLAQKTAHLDAEKASMTPVASAVDDVIHSVSAYFYDSCPVMLQKLIALIDIPFTREPAALTEALQKAETDPSFLHSWCVLFRPPAEEKTHLSEKELEEHADGYVIIEEKTHFSKEALAEHADDFVIVQDQTSLALQAR